MAAISVIYAGPERRTSQRRRTAERRHQSRVTTSLAYRRSGQERRRQIDTSG
ncbi:MAG: hypothetical protein OEY07_06590 [Gammaproteobacteria bacterium]|nr:hypothetical protein [Gammaproteobacteria bacterium]